MNTSQTVSAFGIAATQAAGLVEMLGSQARVLNAGFAARNGLAAARLAAEGFQGPPRPLEGLRGFMSVFGGGHDAAQLVEGWGERWELTNVAYKPYPCGVVLHAMLDAALAAKDSLARATEIVVSLHPLAIERTDRPEPRDAIEARLSAQHAIAVAALRGRAGVEEFTDAAANHPELRAFRRRVRIVRDESLDKMAAVIAAGSVSLRAPAPLPMDDARLEAKLRELAGPRADAWKQLAYSLESTAKVSLPD